MPRLTPVLRLPLAVVATAMACTQQSVKLRDTPPVGQVSRYRMTMQSWVHPPVVAPADSMELILAETVYTTSKVVGRSGGLWTTTMHFDSSRFMSKLPGAPSGDLLRGVTMRVVVDSLGRRDSTTVTIPPGANPLVAQGSKIVGGMGGSGISMPFRAVRVGESWTDSTSTSVPVGGKSQSFQSRIRYRLERLEHQGGDLVAVLSSRTTVTEGGAAASADPFTTATANYNLDLSTGQLLRETLETQMNHMGHSRMVLQLLR